MGLSRCGQWHRQDLRTAIFMVNAVAAVIRCRPHGAHEHLKNEKGREKEKMLEM